jgi:hypothetical protein
MGPRTRTRAVFFVTLALAGSFIACAGCGGSSKTNGTGASESAGGELAAHDDSARLSGPLTIRDVGFRTPESVLYDPEADVYLVSNIEGSALEADGRAFISRLLPNGTLDALKWIDSAQPGVELDAPKGMALFGKVLYVADITHVRKFDRKTGKPLGSITIAGATFLNDITVEKNGDVIVSDTGLTTGFSASGTDALYRIDQNDQVTPLVKTTELGKPNGLLAAADGLWVVTFGSGELYKVSDTGERSDVLKLPKGSLYGIVATNHGTLVSSWEGSAIYRLSGGQTEEVVSGVDAPADIGYDSKRNRVLIPLFNADAVVIHQL